jgi:hypothetical protein
MKAFKEMQTQEQKIMDTLREENKLLREENAQLKDELFAFKHKRTIEQPAENLSARQGYRREPEAIKGGKFEDFQY